MKVVKTMFCVFFLLASFLPMWTKADGSDLRPEKSTRAGWETIKIVSEDGHQYIEKIACRFHPSGTIYIVSEDHDLTARKRAIKLYKYDGHTASLVKNISETSNKAYEADMEIGDDGWIHIAWAEGASEVADTQYIKYRYFDGANWSDIKTLKTMTILGTPSPLDKEKIDDVRIAVDKSHNVFIAHTVWPTARANSFSLYGDQVYLDNLPYDGRSKHPMIACDEQYVHLAWVQLIDREYTIQYARRANKAGSSWSTVIRAGRGIVDRVFIRVNRENKLHLVYLKTNETGKRDIWHRSLDGETFSDHYPISDTNAQLYHPPDIAAYDENNMMVAVQTWAGGADNFYNWKKNGVWGGFKAHDKVPSTVSYHCCALNPYGTAAIAYSSGGSIKLSINGPLTVNNLPVAVLNTDKDSLFWSEKISMNANNSYDTDGSIVRYKWTIIQDKEELEGQSVTYTFLKKYGTVRVRLTVIDDKEGNGIAEKNITVKALFTAPSKAVKKMIQTLVYKKEGYAVEWTPNAKNEAAGYNIVGYKIFRRATGGSEWLQVGEVAGDRRAFADVSIEAGKTYTYAVSSVDDQGRYSPYDNF